MANFQTRFDEAVAEARRVVVNSGDGIREIIPRFYGDDFRRLTSSISKLLEQVDKNKVDHPEYLAHANGNIAERAVEVILSVPTSVQSGPSHFVQTTLPSLLQCEERLSKAVGSYYYKVKEFKDKQVREIQKLAEESFGYRESARKALEASNTARDETKKVLDQVKSLGSAAETAATKVSEVRELVTKLASGDGRGKSLEALKRTAEAKLESIEAVLKKATGASDRAEAASKSIDSTLSEANNSVKATSEQADEVLKKIEAIQGQAESVLNLSSQAGLARSYLKESQKLAIRSYIYTGILYATSGAAALIAAFYVLPSLEQSVSSSAGHLVENALPIALLRATVLAPLVFVIYFTTRQISSLETLRMDYAEKAAASLAYSGYKDEMSVDMTLLERLRGSLLLKFAEHPERLLRKRPVRDTIEVEAPGFKATSTSAEVPTPRMDKVEET